MRSRILQPGFFKNEELAECDPMARLLFQGLWCIADREGKFEWRPKRIQAELFPYDIGCDILCLLGQLKAPLLIAQYDINGNEYGIIPNFAKHQSIHPHEKKSILPDPPENYLTIPLNVITSSDKSLNESDTSLSTSLSTSPSLSTSDILPLTGKSRQRDCRHEEIIQIYHDELPTLPNIIEWDNTARKWLKARWRSAPERQDLDFWKEYFQYVSGSPFLLGDNDRGWTADLRWLVKSQNFAKVINGNYHTDKQSRNKIALEVWLEIHRRREEEGVQ